MIYIIIGGIAKSGTSSISVFLGIHPKIKAYDGPKLHPKIEDFEKGNRQMVQEIIKPWHMKQELQKRIDQKKEDVVAIIRRGDCFEKEWQYLNEEKRKHKDIRFIYCMRDDARKPLRSILKNKNRQDYHKYFDSYSQHVANSMLCFSKIDMPKRVVCIDRCDYTGLMQWLKIPLSESQRAFIGHKVITHISDYPFPIKLDDLTISFKLREQYAAMANGS